MGEGANRVLAGIVGSFCEGRRSAAPCFEFVEIHRHLQHTQAFFPATARLDVIITYRALRRDSEFQGTWRAGPSGGLEINAKNCGSGTNQGLGPLPGNIPVFLL